MFFIVCFIKLKADFHKFPASGFLVVSIPKAPIVIGAGTTDVGKSDTVNFMPSISQQSSVQGFKSLTKGKGWKP
ncbi:MAG: hypothetical protein B6I19_11470 [Bacteroidetes bacterium 4572_114]|nr:MAG: hypothetical protein B6I19_11470 [Bacteroidetes bacterium 4572_114]